MPNFKAEQLYIKLDKKLILQAARIDVSISSIEEKKTPVLNSLKISPIVNFARKNFQLFKIDTLYINEHKVTFSYTDHPDKPSDNSATIADPDQKGTVFFKVYEDYVMLSIPDFVHIPSKTHIRATGLYDFKTEMSYTHFNLSLPENANIHLYSKDNGDSLAFTASSNTFTQIGSIVALFELKKNISKWIVDYNGASSFKLLQAKGIYSYSDPHLILSTLSIHAKEKALAYTFNEKLSPVISNDADIYFSKGVLDIQPHNAFYNKHPIADGGVKIDFNGKDVILYLDLKVNATLETDIVDILKAYNIPLPLLQENGTTQANIQLVVNLWTEKAYATGQFFVKESDLILDGAQYKIKNAAVRLNKTVLTIDAMKLQFQDIFTTDLNGQMNLTQLMGDFYFDVDKVWLPLSEDKHLKLVSKNPQLHLKFTKDGEAYILPKTQWTLDDLNITIEPIHIPLTEKFSSTAKLKDLNLQIDDLIKFKVNGQFDLPKQHAQLDINASSFSYINGDFNLSSLNKNIPLKFIYDNNASTIKTLTKTSLLLNNNLLTIMPTELRIKGGNLDLNRTEVSLNNTHTSKLSGHYKLGSKTLNATASHTMIHNDKFLFITPTLNLTYKQQNGAHYIDANKFGIHAVYNTKKELDIKIKDFSKIYPYSKMMQRYDIRKGHATLTVIDERVGLDLSLSDFHPLLSKNGKDITQYTIKGDYQNETANLQINKNIDLLYRKKGKLTAKHIDFNLFPILDYIKFIDTNDQSGSDLDLIIKTKDCDVMLGSSGRKIISDSIKIQINKDQMDAQLIHGEGGVLFKSHDNNMSVFARGLNDEFMNGLFKFSTFQGGKLSFVMTGPFDDMKGGVDIDNTVIKDYTVLNNTLAFFNTIPSLVTFSVPSYSKEGLRVDKMYASFHKTGSLIKIENAKITSKELTITAKGESDFDKENIDVLMQVKTDLGSSAKDIPLLGYIIFGDDTISTTVRVHGPLSDPEVENSMAKSVIVAPFNIIKRTLMLPFKAMGLFEDDNSSAVK